MTESVATTTSPDDDDLARLAELERQLGRQPGRPSVIKHLGVTDARARKLIAAHNDATTTSSTHHHQPSAGASTVRHLAPAEHATTSHQCDLRWR